MIVFWSVVVVWCVCSLLVWFAIDHDMSWSRGQMEWRGRHVAAVAAGPLIIAWFVVLVLVTIPYEGAREVLRAVRRGW